MAETINEDIEKQNEESIFMILDIAEQIGIEDNSFFTQKTITRIFADENITSLKIAFHELLKQVKAQNLELLDDVNAESEGFITTMESELGDVWDIAHIHGLLTHAVQISKKKPILRINKNGSCLMDSTKECFAVAMIESGIGEIPTRVNDVFYAMEQRNQNPNSCTDCKQQAEELVPEELIYRPAAIKNHINATMLDFLKKSEFAG